MSEKKNVEIKIEDNELSLLHHIPRSVSSISYSYMSTKEMYGERIPKVLNDLYTEGDFDSIFDVGIGMGDDETPLGTVNIYTPTFMADFRSKLYNVQISAKTEFTHIVSLYMLEYCITNLIQFIANDIKKKIKDVNLTESKTLIEFYASDFRMFKGKHDDNYINGEVFTDVIGIVNKAVDEIWRKNKISKNHTLSLNFIVLDDMDIIDGWDLDDIVDDKVEKDKKKKKSKKKKNKKKKKKSE